MASVKNNKSRGYAAEREIAERIQKEWPDHFYMERTGLDGGHDLRGKYTIGEVKAVKTGPVWLKDGLAQLDNAKDGEAAKDKILFVKLSQGPGKKVRWVTIMDIEQLEAYLRRVDF